MKKIIKRRIDLREEYKKKSGMPIANTATITIKRSIDDNRMKTTEFTYFDEGYVRYLEDTIIDFIKNRKD